MENAQEIDEESISRDKPAVARIKMLDEVIAQLAKKQVASRLIDNGVLRVLREWLSPHEDGSLPNIRFRTMLYKAIDALQISTDDLERSEGLGKLMMDYWRHPDETPENKKLLASMLEKWMRPMLKLTTNYRELAKIESSGERALMIARRKADLARRRERPQASNARARIPEQAVFDYAVRPASRLHVDEEEEEEKRKEKDQEPDRRAKMSKKLDKMKKTSSGAARTKFRVDISGRK
jgi:hypothetical protein